MIDSHLHLGILYQHNPERIDWLISHGCTVVSWAFGGKIAAASDLKAYFEQRQALFRQLRQRGLDCYHLCGIHPRKIPPDLRPEAVADLLAPFLEDSRCHGIGEIGVETGSAREQEILCAQLEFGLSLNLPWLRFGIHTPRSTKVEVTQKLLKTLEPYEVKLSSISVIDHCTQETIGQVLSRGYQGGVSLSATKSTQAQLVRIMKKFHKDSKRIMCNTDSGLEFYEDLWRAYTASSFDTQITEDLFYGTAARFFGIGT